jgi:NADPH-dependent glutamate synthase beta subunit-like oxidoreductase
MINLTMDNRNIQVPEGTTLLQAAGSLRIRIPTLCFAEGYKPTTSCMVCVVRIAGLKSLVPACATRAAEGMVVTTDDADIRQARKTAIELLLSDHVGDCVGPCQRGCPAGMNIPMMIRRIIDGDFEDAIRTVKKDIPLPAVLGRICSAPCEKVCRRAQADGAVSICALKRFVADLDLESTKPFQPECLPATGKTAAVVGAGPCGLSAAWYLTQAGIDCTLIDAHDQPGGSLRYGAVDPQLLPPDVLESEINQLMSLGIRFQGNTRLGRDVLIADLKSQYDVVLLAVGEIGEATGLGVDLKDNKIQADLSDFTTSLEGVFAAGRCMRAGDLCIRAVADGKNAAFVIRSRLVGENPPKKEYNHQMGRLKDGEMELFLKQAADHGRIESKSRATGFTAAQAQDEARRCLHCDCRKADNCHLRDLATAFDARRNVWPTERDGFEQFIAQQNLVYEPGKCIKCGLCVQTAKRSGEPVGLSFEGRGYAMRIATPLENSLDDSLPKAASECINICPTGALALNETKQQKSEKHV